MATAKDEITYRGINASAGDCLDDSFRAALSILTWGKFEPQDYRNYVQGFKSIAGHIVGMKLNPNNAYLPAAKVMLLAAAIKKNANPFALTIRKQTVFNALPYSLVNKVAKVASDAFDLAALAIRLYEIGDPYESFPIFESQHFLLRAIQDEDIDNLLAVYSDPKSQPFFNSDNCHGDDFHYETLERMRQTMDFWAYSYKNRFFIRWAIVDKRSKSAIGTIEAFARHAGDSYDDCCLLRLDLASDFENKETIEEILSLVHPLFLPLFGASSIATKAIPSASERIKAITALGFVESAEPLIGDDGTEYRHYFQIK
ncbi:MAG: GNAT family protein [Candidatus Enteromonas sp.]|nr:GNAT family protein [Candidatus Enteromonas sp.]